MMGRSLSIRRARGWTYMEALVATGLIAVSLVPAIQSLQSVAQGATNQRTYTVNEQRLETRMEELLARTFAALDAEAVATGNSSSSTSTLFSDAAGTADQLLVTVYRYDGTGATSTDTGLIWVKVAMTGSTLQLNSLALR
jgi:type II secretory pathway component PulJ